MKKKVKKIPKYNGGTPSATPFYQNADFYSQAGDFLGQQVDNIQRSKQGVTGLGVAKGTLTGAGAGAGIGTMIAPGVGTAIGAGIGALAGGITYAWGHGASADVNSSSVDYDDIYTPETGISGWLHDDDDDQRMANMVQNSNLSRMQTEMIREKYARNKGVTPNPNVNAAEGGIVPNDEILVGVTAGEVYRDSNTGEWGIVKGKGMYSKKPKKDDAETMFIPRDSTILNTHPDYVFAEFGNKTPAQIMRPLAKPIKTTGKYAEGTKAAIDATGKKVLYKQELRKQELHQKQIKNKYAKGTPQLGKDPIEKLEEELYKPQTPEITGKDRRWIYHLSKATDAISDFAPLATAMFGNYDYERVSPRIARNHSIPVDYSVNDILTDNQRAHAINNYNVSQMGGSTGAYLAAANQSAANLMKANAQTRIYQKNKQNELIAKNIAQLNDWERYANNQMWAADVATDQNQGMAQQMKDQAKKDGYEFYTGKKYDEWKLAMLEPMYRYGAPDEAYRQIYKRRIL